MKPLPWDARCRPAGPDEWGPAARRVRASLLRADARRRKGKGPAVLGLSAPDVGLPLRVFLTMVGGRELVFANPVVVEASEVRVPFREVPTGVPRGAACEYDTRRHVWVKVRCDNSGERACGPWGAREWSPDDLLLSGVVQQQLARLAGLPPHFFASENYPPATDWGKA